MTSRQKAVAFTYLVNGANETNLAADQFEISAKSMNQDNPYTMNLFKSVKSMRVKADDLVAAAAALIDVPVEQ